MAKTTLEQFTSTPERMRLYQQERAIEQVTAMICRLMDAKKVSRGELAQRLDKVPGWITQILDGEKNKTIRTLSDVLWALGESLEFGHRALSTFDTSPELQNGHAQRAEYSTIVESQDRSVRSLSTATTRQWATRTAASR